MALRLIPRVIAVEFGRLVVVETDALVALSICTMNFIGKTGKGTHSVVKLKHLPNCHDHNTMDGWKNGRTNRMAKKTMHANYMGLIVFLKQFNIVPPILLAKFPIVCNKVR